MSDFRRLILDIECADPDDAEELFDFVANLASRWSVNGNFDMSAGPAPDDACLDRGDAA